MTPSRPRTGLDRRILALAAPSLGALVAEPLFVLIDSAMVGHLGANALAGLSLASTVLTTAVGVFVFLAYATTAATARHLGAGRRTEALRAGVDGIWLALALGVVTGTLLWICAHTLTVALGAGDEVAHAATAYLRASAPGLPGMLVVLAATGVLRGLLDTRTPFVVAIAGALLNVGLNAVLLYGVGMGVAGSGAGTAVAQSVMAVALCLPVLRAARAAGVPLRPHRSGLGASLGAGAPLLVRTLSLRAAILLTVWAATALGTHALAAHQIVTAVWNLSAFTLDALAVAAQALIGTALGQEEARRGSAALPAGVEPVPGERVEPSSAPGPGRIEAPLGVEAVLRRTLVWGAGTGVVIGVVLVGASPWLPLLFTTDSAVSLTAGPALVLAGCAMPLAGVVFLLDGVLIGAGDGRYLARMGLLTLVSYAPLAVLVAHGWPVDGDGGLVWLWAAFAVVFMGARALVNGLRARGTAWRH